MPWDLETKRRRGREQYHKHSDIYIPKQREYRRLLRKEVFEAYGNKCVCCGITQLLFLTIDHIEGNGNAHRKSINRSSGAGFYSWLKQNGYPPQFQILCFNCNMGRERNKGICPHSSEDLV